MPTISPAVADHMETIINKNARNELTRFVAYMRDTFKYRNTHMLVQRINQFSVVEQHEPPSLPSLKHEKKNKTWYNYYTCWYYCFSAPIIRLEF